MGMGTQGSQMNDPFGVSKSFPYEKGKPGSKFIPVTRMDADSRSVLRSDIERVRRTRKERKIPTGKLKRPGNPSKRPPTTKAEWKSKSRAKRVEAKAKLPKAPPPQLGKTTFMPWTVKTNIGLAAAGTGAAAYTLHRRHKQGVSKADKKRIPDEAIGALGGAAATETAYVAGGQAAKHAIAAHRKKNWDNKKHNPIWSAHRKKHGIEQMRGRIDNKKKIKFYTDYPKELPGGRATRALAFKNKNSTYVTALGAGAATGALIANKTKKDRVSKSDKYEKYAKEGAGAALGAGVGQGLYQSVGYGPKTVIRTNSKLGYGHNVSTGKIKDPKIKARKKAWEKAKKAQKKKGLYPTDPKTKAKFWRTLPKGTYAGKYLRTTGYTHAGRAGVATGAASTALGAGVGFNAMKEKK